jgi:hypothetical protein
MATPPDRSSSPLSYLARVYLAAGRADGAIRVLEELLAVPSWVTRPALRADPLWDPLRSHPAFRRLLEGMPSA